MLESFKQPEAGNVGIPVPYAMTNCHNSLCAVGGTINERMTMCLG